VTDTVGDTVSDNPTITTGWLTHRLLCVACVLTGLWVLVSTKGGLDAVAKVLEAVLSALGILVSPVAELGALQVWSGERAGSRGAVEMHARHVGKGWAGRVAEVQVRCVT
jgi:hypothetical protein